MTDFKSKYGPWALVAGASEGLGAAFAEELAKLGLNLILLARRQDKLNELSKRLNDVYQVEIRNHSIDLSDFQKTKQLILQLEMDINLLVYNAAYAPIGYFEDISEEDLSQIVKVNIQTPLLLTKLLSVNMIEQSKGGIILMSSLSGNQGSPKIATYAASKSFTAIFAEGLWYELRNQGVDVLASCAGAVRTPGYKNAQDIKDAPGTLDANIVAQKTLKALGKGPTTVAGFVNKMALFFMGRLFPRKLAISMMDKNTRDLS